MPVKKIECTNCKSEINMEVHETLDNNIYCSCVKCGLSYIIKEAQEVIIEGNNYMFLPLMKAAYRQSKIVTTHFYKIGLTKTGVFKKRAETIGNSSMEYDYINKIFQS